MEWRERIDLSGYTTVTVESSIQTSDSWQNPSWADITRQLKGEIQENGSKNNSSPFTIQSKTQVNSPHYFQANSMHCTIKSITQIRPQKLQSHQPPIYTHIFNHNAEVWM